MLGIGLGITQLSLRAPFSPLTLFAASEPGLWLDPSDLTTLFQDNAGTTPVTAPGQSVGLALDKSQGLVLGPELVVNGDFSNGTTGWTHRSTGTGTFTAAGGAANIVGTDGSNRGWFTQTLSLTAGTFYEISVAATVTSGSGVLVFGSASGSGQIAISASGVYRQIVPASATTIYVGGQTGSGGGNLTLDNISVRELPGNHATQPVFASRPTYRVTSGIPNIEDDLVDDAINWKALAGNYTVAWVDTAGTVTIQTAQALTGATDALKAQNMVGYVAIGRALTAAETASLTAWFKAKAGV